MAKAIDTARVEAIVKKASEEGMDRDETIVKIHLETKASLSQSAKSYREAAKKLGVSIRTRSGEFRPQFYEWLKEKPRTEAEVSKVLADAKIMGASDNDRRHEKHYQQIAALANAIHNAK